MWRFARYALVATLALFLLVPGALAHAWLLEAQPGPSQQVPSAPNAVFLRFTEDVERQYTRAEVFDLNGTRVDAGRVIFDDQARNQIIVPLEELQDQVYQVKWYTLSVDSHTASGSYVFAVGTASLEGAPPATSTHLHGSGLIRSEVEAAGRAVYYAAAGFALGFGVFHLLVSPPALGRFAEGPGFSRGAKTLLGIIGLGLVGGATVLYAFSERVGSSFAGAATDFRTGQLLVARLVFLALAALPLAIALNERLNTNARRALVASTGLAAASALVATSLSSHAAALSDGRLLAIGADTVHLWAGSVWAGGLFAFAFLIPTQPSITLGRVVLRFSPMAVVCVGLVLATGIYASLQHLRTPGDLVAGNYGRSILWKASLFVPLIALGAVNRYVIGPKLPEQPSKQRALLRTVGAETILIIAVFAGAGVLATSAPPSVAFETIIPSTLVLEKPLEKAHLLFQVAPNPPRVGIQNLTVSLHAYNQQPNPNGTIVGLKFAFENQPEPEEVHTMTRVTTDDWFLRGGYFTERGNWTVYVIVQRPDEYAKVPFRVSVR